MDLTIWKKVTEDPWGRGNSGKLPSGEGPGQRTAGRGGGFKGKVKPDGRKTQGPKDTAAK